MAFHTIPIGGTLGAEETDTAPVDNVFGSAPAAGFIIALAMSAAYHDEKIAPEGMNILERAYCYLQGAKVNAPGRSTQEFDPEGRVPRCGCGRPCPTCSK